MRQIAKLGALFLVGGITYYGMECLWRGHSHWTMAVLGGLMFVIVGGLNEWFPWEMPLIAQGVVGSIVITVAEYYAGLVLNIWMALDIWDYSHLPLNLYGQICLSYSLLWVLLSMFAVVLDDWIRYRWFGEERPYYILFH